MEDRRDDGLQLLKCPLKAGILHETSARCSKKQDHSNFIPVAKFTVDDLPHGCRDNDLVDLVHAVSDLTVRVSVWYASEWRPETNPGRNVHSSKVYVYGSRGLTIIMTGWVYEVTKRTDKNNHYKTCQCARCQNSSESITCHCRECLNSHSPKTEFAYIYIHTSANTVYDDQEARLTICDLFFYNGRDPRDDSDTVSLTDMSVVRSNADIGFCEMRCVTHDLELADKLKKMVKHMDNVGKIIYDKHRRLKLEKQKSSSLAEQPPDALDNLTIIVSHPHGFSQHVSIGYCVGEDERKDNFNTLKYTAATCPGCPGALVIVLKDGRCLHWGNNIAHHSVENDYLNKSNLVIF